MIEVPITMALIVAIIMIGLGLFTFFVIARFFLKRLSGDSEKNRGKESPRPILVSAGKDAEISRLPSTSMTIDQDIPHPVLVIGGTENQGEKQVWRIHENDAFRRLLRRGLLSRGDEALLKDCVAELKRIMSVDEQKTEGENLPAPELAVNPVPMPANNKSSRGMFNLLSREKDAPEEPISMALQMDAILRTILKSLPGDPINLRIDDGPEGDLRIWYQSKAYHGLDELPDPHIRALIQQAADTWLNQNTKQR